VTIPATVPQGSEIPEGLMNNAVLGLSAYRAVNTLHLGYTRRVRKVKINHV
jgi:hypothetical protein